MKPKFFASPDEFRKWLDEHHDIAKELLVGFYKVHTGKPSMTWSQSVDEALCYGWIDGVRTSIDDDRYQIRFTPRKPDSIWSAVNIKKIQELTVAGKMKPAGIKSYESRTEKKSGIYSFEKRGEVKFPPAMEKEFKSHKNAWKYFQALAPSYQKTSVHWVLSAKQESTQAKRLQQLITESEAGTNQWKDNKYVKKKN